MKPMLTTIKGVVSSFEPTMNGHIIEVIDSGKNYMRCFITPETISKSHVKPGSIKPNKQIKIKGIRDVDIYGNEVFSIEYVSVLKKEEDSTTIQKNKI